MYLMFCLTAVFLPVSGCYLVNAFIRRHQGRLPGKPLTVILSAVCIVLAFSVFHTLQGGQYLLPARILLLYVFSLMFVLLDLSNCWLPLTFTAPFCALTLLSDSLPWHVPATGLVSMAAMGALLATCRWCLNRRYRQDVMGPGDIWMMSGLAAYFSFIPAAILLCAGLAGMLIVAPARKTALPLAPFVLFFAVLFCLWQQAVLFNRSFI